MLSQAFAKQCRSRIRMPTCSTAASRAVFQLQEGKEFRHFTETNYNSKLNTSFNLIDVASSSERSRHPLTKIVATIGPTSEQLEPLQKVVEAGMKIMRLNFSHATKEEVELRLENLSASQDSTILMVQSIRYKTYVQLFSIHVDQKSDRGN